MMKLVLQKLAVAQEVHYILLEDGTRDKTLIQRKFVHSADRHRFMITNVTTYSFKFRQEATWGQNISAAYVLLFSTYALQPSRLIVRSGLDVSTFATRRLHVCHQAREPSGERWNCGREISENFA
jgi:hypothetical protein